MVDLPAEEVKGGLKRKQTVKEKKQKAWLKKAKYLYPDNKIAVLIGVSDYSQLRDQNPNYQHYKDVLNVKDDLRNIREGLAGVGFSDDNEDPTMNDYIVTLENPNFEKLNEVLKDVKMRVDANWKKRENTLVYWYVTGNGVHEGDTSLVCPCYTKGKNSQWKYKIEAKLRHLAT